MAANGRISETTVWICLIWTVIFSGNEQYVNSQVELEFSTVNHRAKDGGVLYVFCKIWDLSRSHTVTISRFNYAEELTRNEDVLMSENPNTFLATRELSDDSTAFLLAMLGVTREDAGNYTCEVTRREGNELVIFATKTIPVEVRYLPPSDYPVCSPGTQERVEVQWGKEIIFNCSAELSKPPVTLTWMVAGTEEQVDLDMVYESRSGGFVYSHMRYTPGRNDNDIVFICEAMSFAFPMEEKQSCYIGPLVVTDIPETTTPMVTTTLSQQTVRSPDIASTPTHSPYSTQQTVEEECIDESPCPLFDPDAMPWIAASVAGGIVAVMFFLIAIILCVQVQRMKTLAKTRRKAILEAAAREGPYDLPYDTIQRARYTEDENAYIAAIARARLRANAEAKGLVMVREESHYDDLPARPPIQAGTLPTTSGITTVSQPVVVPPEPPSTPRKGNAI